MNSATDEPLKVAGDEQAILGELLEAERAKLLVEIRHTHHRVFREELRGRLTTVERLLGRCRDEAGSRTAA